MNSKKKRTVFLCSHCGHEHMRWQGYCSSCNARNCLNEELGSATVKSQPSKRGGTKPQTLNQVGIQDDSRIQTRIQEVDLVLGGGIVPGSVILLGGEPGIGKSTLILQVCKGLCTQGIRVLYVSGEESASQVKLRASRLGLDSKELYLYSEVELETILGEVQTLEPKILVLDSIQTVRTRELDSSPGSVSQVRECTYKVLECAKTQNIPVLLVGHVTKGGEIAGPRLLEHMVDVVLSFEGDKNHYFRILRGTKNRFGATDEVGIFEMKSTGLQAVENPSSYFISETSPVPGSSLSLVMEGSQPFLVEVQALVTSNQFTYPKRTAMGFDLNRLTLLIAVLEKRMGVILGQSDVYVSLAGGVKTSDPSLDLAVILAILSSLKDRRVPRDVVVMGEVGLGGEIRLISRVETRIKEARKQGFKRFYVPRKAVEMQPECRGPEIHGVKTIRDVNSLLDG
jgi:DNA repair protein RadA/Sms